MKIAFVGNCQAALTGRFLQRCTRRLAGVEIRPFHWLHTFSDADKQWVTSADVLVRQVSRDKVYASLTPETGRIVYMPLAAAQFLWPFAGKSHPQNEKTITPFHPEGLYRGQLMDSRFLQIIANRQLSENSSQADVDSAIDEYLALDYTKLLDLDRLLQVSMNKIREESALVGYDISGQIERDFRAVPLFATHLHVEARLFRVMCLRLVEQLGFSVTPDEIDAALLSGGRLNPFSSPVHPSVARHFDLAWVGETPTCRHGVYGTLTIREFCRRAATLQQDRIGRLLWQANKKVRADPGDDKIARDLEILKKMLRENHHNAEFRLQYAEVLGRCSRHAEALPHLIAAARLEPTHPGYVLALTRALSRNSANEHDGDPAIGAWQAMPPSGQRATGDAAHGGAADV